MSKKNNFNIINIAVNEFKPNSPFVQDCMYNPYLGDMMAVDNYVKRIKNHTNYQQNDYNICSIYLTHVEQEEEKPFRHNKAIIQKLLQALMEFESGSGVTNYYVVFIHAHGYPIDPNEGFSILVDATQNEESDRKESKITKEELFNLLTPIIEKGPTFLILNSCFSATENISNTKAHSEIYKFEEFANDDVFKTRYDGNYPENNFYFLGMSSALVQSNLFNDGTYGIKILKGLFEMGLITNLNDIIIIFKTLLDSLNANSKFTMYHPFLRIYSKNADQTDLFKALQLESIKDFINRFKLFNEGDLKDLIKQ